MQLVSLYRNLFVVVNIVFRIPNFKMSTSHTTSTVLAAVIIFASLANALTYPKPVRGTVQDNYFGTNVQDPYRWMEDSNAEATKSFVNAQNTLSATYFKQCPFREQMEDKLYDAYDYTRSFSPEKRGKYTFQFGTEDGKEQRILYVQFAGMDNNSPWQILLDSNTFSDDGTIALTNTYFSDDGEMFAYRTSVSGSDWQSVHFMNVSTKEILNDVLTKVKFANLVWKGNEGVFYAHFPDFEGNPEGDDTGTNENHKISYHRVGTPQSEDVIVVEFLDKPHNLFQNIHITRNEDYLIVTLDSSAADRGSYDQTAVYYVNLTDNNTTKWQIRPLLEEFVAAFNFIADVNGTLYFLTNFNAPRYKIVGTRLSAPEPASWTTLVEEDAENVLIWAMPINKEYLLLHYLENVSSKLVLRSLIQGNSFSKDIAIEKGSVSSFTGEIDDSVLFIYFESSLVVNRIYKLDFAKNVSDIQLEVYESGEIEGVDPGMLQINQVWYSSKDGTQVPMYIMHKKDLVLDGSSPAMLHGYGGFNVNYLLDYSAPRIVFMQSLNGVAAIANIRGGGEFGKAWHKAGSLLNKQNVFDDFHAAAEYLIAKNYTSASKMIIQGDSNGGLLVAACVNQRPELYGAAIAHVGVMDMLRYQKFTVGHTWVPEFGSSEDPVHFQNIYKYSPLHNIRFPTRNGTQYPAILVVTSDHDDRVVPSHSYKYTAELQYKIGSNIKQTRPLLLRVDTDAGHSSGLTGREIVEKEVDILSFLIESLDLTFEGQGAHSSGVIVSSSIVTIILTTIVFDVYGGYAQA